MYIEKRWLVPAALSLLLVGGLFAGVLLLLGSRFPQESGRLGGAPITNGKPRSAAEAAATSDPPPFVIPATEAAPPAAVGADRQTAGPSPEEVVDIATSGSGATQINTRGFGDVGLQLQDVNINGPVTMVHISNQGNNNTTNVNIGKNDRIASDQRHLQSNRSDGSAPPTAAPTGGSTSGRSHARPAQRVRAGSRPSPSHGRSGN